MDSIESRKAAGILLCLLILACFAPVVATDYFTCAICGKSRNVTRVLGITAQASDQETECSRWYDMSVEPSHSHVWVRGTWRDEQGVFGFPRLGSNLAERASGPLNRFGSGERLMIYQHSPSAADAREIFLRLAFWETDPVARAWQRRIEHEVAEWSNGGFVGSFPDGDLELSRTSASEVFQK